MYNTEKYIENCLSSLINQDINESDYEILVVDDGSTDNSANIVASFAKTHKNIKLHKQANQGITKTSNRLLGLARGKYLYKIDSDDYIAHNTLGALLNIAEENNLEVLGFDSCDTVKLDLHELDSEINGNDLEICSGIAYWAKAKKHILGANWYIMNREFLIKNNRTFELEDNPMCDTPFTFQLLIAAQRFAYVPNIIHRYVQVPSSGSNNKNADHLKKRILKRTALIYKLNSISKELEEKNNMKYSHMIGNLKLWSDVNVYFILQKFLYLNTSIKDINKHINHLKQIGAYPMLNFAKDETFSKRHGMITSLLNRKLLFFLLLYPLRLLVSLKILKLKFR